MDQTSPTWETRPISATCEVMRGNEQCGLATSYAYPSSGVGWMSLCDKHAQKHPEARHISQLIANGETWE